MYTPSTELMDESKCWSKDVSRFAWTKPFLWDDSKRKRVNRKENVQFVEFMV